MAARLARQSWCYRGGEATVPTDLMSNEPSDELSKLVKLPLTFALLPATNNFSAFSSHDEMAER